MFNTSGLPKSISVPSKVSHWRCGSGPIGDRSKILLDQKCSWGSSFLFFIYKYQKLLCHLKYPLIQGFRQCKIAKKSKKQKKRANMFALGSFGKKNLESMALGARLGQGSAAAPVFIQLVRRSCEFMDS
jgi:hypothetical protein